jgi:hypothetical protein
MKDGEIVERLRREVDTMSPIQLADLLDSLLPDGVGQFPLLSFFKRAFPLIPLQTLIQANRWKRLCDKGLSDDEFDALLNPWLGPGRTKDRQSSER